MATTTNFGWQTPDDTDLVKDGASAIRTLGSSIDTSLVDLKGGTTGQILAKTSNTDMDFTWVANDVGDITEVTVSSPLTGGGSSGSVNVAIQDGTTAQKGAVQLEDSTSSTSTTKAATPNSVKSAYDLADAAIPESLVDAKGDLLTATADNTPARLAVGNSGETLVADSAATVGLRYSATPSASNPVLNSAMQVWQRGTSISLTASSGVVYTADRWATSTNANQACTVARQATNDTTNLPSIQYAMRYQRNSGQTGTGLLLTTQSFETINSIPFAGKTVTVSFYARAGANFSSASSVLVNYLMTGTGTDQNRQSGAYTGEVTGNNNATLTTTWQRFSYSYSVAATATEIATGFAYTPVGTASTNDYFEVTGVQIDIGSVALPFRTQNSTIQGELAACQRYYQRFGGYTAFENIGQGSASSATRGQIKVCLPVTMRTSATSVDYSTLNLSDGVSGFAVTAVTIDQAGKNMIAIFADVASGLTQYRNYFIYANNSTSAFLGFSAEL